MHKRIVITLLALFALALAGSSLAVTQTSNAAVSVDAASFEILALLGFETPEWIAGPPTEMSYCSTCLRRCGSTGGICVPPPDWCACF